MREERYQGQDGGYENREAMEEIQKAVAYPENEWDGKAITDIQQAVDILSHVVNGTRTIAPKAFAVVLGKQHRTLQAGIMRLFVDMCEIYCDMPFDLRNRAAVEFAEKAADLNACLPLV